MYHRFFAAAFVVLGLLAAPSQAQDLDTAEVETISFDDAVDIALERSIEIRQALNNLEASGSEVTTGRADLLPDLSASFSGSQRFGTTFDQTAGDFVSENAQSANASISSSVTLFDGLGNIASLRGSEFGYEGSQHNLERTRQEVVFQVMDSYLALVESRENVRIQEENLEAAEQQHEQIEEFVRVGTQPRSDLYQQEAEVAAAEFDLLEAERQAEVNETQLIRLLQLDPFGAYEFQVPTIEDEQLAPDQYNVANLIEEALLRRSDLRAQEASLSASQQSIREARSGYFPNISLSAGTSSSYSSAAELGFSDQFFNNRRTESIGFSVSIPIFDRLQTRNQVRQAQIQHEETQLQLEDLEQEVAVQVRQAHLDYESAEKRLDVARTQEAAAERALEAARERYNVGSGTLLEVTQAQAGFVSASSNLVQARYDFVFQQRLIDFYVGTLDPEQPLFE